MAAKQTLILITGGNGGIGFSLASQLLADPTKHVLLGSRSAEKGLAAIKDLGAQNLPGKVELVQIDVASEESIAAAAKKVEADHGRLDALVNNAAVAFVPGATVAQQMATCYQTNTIGPLLTVDYFTPLLSKAASGTPRIVNVSSRQGSISIRLDPSVFGHNIKAPQYRASKAALNMVTACQEVELKDKGFKVFAYCPGFTVSNLSGGGNTVENGAKPTSEGAGPIVALLNGERDAEHGKFVHEHGVYPW